MMCNTCGCTVRGVAGVRLSTRRAAARCASKTAFIYRRNPPPARHAAVVRVCLYLTETHNNNNNNIIQPKKRNPFRQHSIKTIPLPTCRLLLVLYNNNNNKKSRRRSAYNMHHCGARQERMCALVTGFHIRKNIH